MRKEIQTFHIHRISKVFESLLNAVTSATDEGCCCSLWNIYQYVDVLNFSELNELLAARLQCTPGCNILV